MGSVNSFEELEIWQEARILVKEVYALTSPINDYGFKDQVRRAVVSVMNNIAEGFERSSNKDFIRFLFIAKTSCGEVRSMLYLGLDLLYFEEMVCNCYISKCRVLSAKIGKLIVYLNKHL